MVIVLIGGVHEYFSCKDKLISILAGLSKMDRPPKFVAVEYGESFFKEHILPQRSTNALEKRPEYYQRTIKSVLSKKEMEIGAEYVAYDGVCHKDFFPEVPTVWLDDKRPVEDGHIQAANSMLYNRLASIAAFKRKTHNFLKLSYNALFEAIKKTELGTAKSLPPNPERELLWIKELEPHLTEDSEEYGIAIVGAAHTKDEEGLLHNLLKKRGHKVLVQLTC